jgi:hypothetical protein
MMGRQVGEDLSRSFAEQNAKQRDVIGLGHVGNIGPLKVAKSFPQQIPIHFADQLYDFGPQKLTNLGNLRRSRWRARCRPNGLQPQMQPAVEHVGQRSTHYLAHGVWMIPRTEMGGDNQLVVKSLAAVDQVIQVHVAELVNVLLAVVRGHKGQFAD